MKSTDNVLTKLPYFAELVPQVQDEIVRSAIRVCYEPDEVVLLEGMPAKGMYVVEAGWLKVVKTSPEGREQVLRFLGPGEVFNAIGVFAELPISATVIALESATAWMLERESLLRLVDQHPQIAKVIMRSLARRVVHLVSMVEDLSLRTVEARLARYLVEQAETAATVHRQRWATQSEMAARLGTVLDVLNRALHGLADQGLIRVERHQIQILNMEGLREKAMLT
ncbi:MAG: Crp/Fnr family transcriptional regulator [Anaerolineae bacterium]